MANLKEIEGMVKNINYYSQQIADICVQQTNEDGEKTEMNVHAGSTRFTSLGLIISACSWLDVYCLNILSNLKTAQEQGKKLHLIDEQDS